MKRTIVPFLLAVLRHACCVPRSNRRNQNDVQDRCRRRWSLGTERCDARPPPQGDPRTSRKDAPVTIPPDAFLVGNWTSARVRALNDSLLADPAIDMIIGMGLITSQDLATRGPLPKPVIAPIVIDPQRQHIPMKNGTSGVKNLNYLVYPTTFVRDLQLYREIIPIHKLVNISIKPYDDVLPAPHVPFEEIGKRLGLEITELHLGYSADSVLEALPPDADAVFRTDTLPSLGRIHEACQGIHRPAVAELCVVR